jgi:hypothetical protein
MPEDAYVRGAKQGEVDARLDAHDQHFAAINISLAQMSREMHDMALGMQRLGNQAEARDAIAINTAAALREREEQVRLKYERDWTPVARTVAIIAMVLMAISTAISLYLAVIK